VQKGDLKLAISTNGKSPTVAKRLKEVLNESLPAELDTTLQQMSELRNTLEGDFADKVKKLNNLTPYWLSLKQPAGKILSGLSGQPLL
jgi:siroheme synthase (precorrin-2 oxidase/ferrochelatase)